MVFMRGYQNENRIFWKISCYLMVLYLSWRSSTNPQDVKRFVKSAIAIMNVPLERFTETLLEVCRSGYHSDTYPTQMLKD